MLSDCFDIPIKQSCHLISGQPYSFASFVNYNRNRDLSVVPRHFCTSADIGTIPLATSLAFAAFGLDRTARRPVLTNAIAGLLDSSCIVFRLFICLSQNLVVRRDQRNQKKAYREDLGRRARPTQSKQCSRRRRLQSH